MLNRPDRAPLLRRGLYALATISALSTESSAQEKPTNIQLQSAKAESSPNENLLNQVALPRVVNERVGGLLLDLDSDSFGVRERATRELIDAGQFSRDECEAIVKNYIQGNPEVRSRVKLLLKHRSATEFSEAIEGVALNKDLVRNYNQVEVSRLVSLMLPIVVQEASDLGRTENGKLIVQFMVPDKEEFFVRQLKQEFQDIKTIADVQAVREKIKGLEANSHVFADRYKSFSTLVGRVDYKGSSEASSSRSTKVMQRYAKSLIEMDSEKSQSIERYLDHLKAYSDLLNAKGQSSAQTSAAIKERLIASAEEEHSLFGLVRNAENVKVSCFEVVNKDPKETREAFFAALKKDDQAAVIKHSGQIACLRKIDALVNLTENSLNAESTAAFRKELKSAYEAGSECRVMRIADYVRVITESQNSEKIFSDPIFQELNEYAVRYSYEEQALCIHNNNLRIFKCIAALGNENIGSKNALFPEKLLKAQLSKPVEQWSASEQPEIELMEELVGIYSKFEALGIDKDKPEARGLIVKAFTAINSTSREERRAVMSFLDNLVITRDQMWLQKESRELIPEKLLSEIALFLESKPKPTNVNVLKSPHPD